MTRRHMPRYGARRDANEPRLIRELRQLGFVVVKLDPHPDEPGTPDLLILRWGQQAVAEVKTKRGELSAVQKEWRDRWLAEGGLYIVARRAEDVLEAYGRI